MPSELPASRGASMIRIVVVIVVVLAGAGAAVAWFLRDDPDHAVQEAADEAGVDDGAVEPMELEAEMTVIDDEIWVFGGRAGPDGSEHPVPSSIPENWDDNRSVIMYGSDGSLRFHTIMDGDELLWGADVVADGPDRYLITSVPCSDPHCSNGFVPRVYRLRDDRAEAVPLDSADSYVGIQNLEVVGAAGHGVVWAIQQSPDDDADGLPTPRLVAIDLRAGQLSEIALPDRFTALDGVCSTGSDVYALLPIRHESLIIDAFDVVRRPATPGPADWTLTNRAELPADGAWTAALRCLDDGEVVVLTHGMNELHPMSTWTVRDDEQVLDGGSSVPIVGMSDTLGRVGDTTVYAGWEPLSSELHLAGHVSGRDWVAIDNSLSWDSRAAVVAGQLMDVTEAVSRLDPDGVDLPVIEIPSAS